jgi:hypothetical protein
MFHHEGPIRWGALTRAATAAISTKKIERQMIPANLIRGETGGRGTVASGCPETVPLPLPITIVTALVSV